MCVGGEAVHEVNAEVEPAAAVQWWRRLPAPKPLTIALGILKYDPVAMLDILARLFPRDPHPHSMRAAGRHAEGAIFSSTLTRQCTLSKLFANNILSVGIS